MVTIQVRLFTPVPVWMKDERVKCQGMQPARFYPNSPNADVARAKSFCKGTAESEPCYFLEQCLKHAIDEHEQFGVWGGTSERERRKIWRARKALKDDTIYTLKQAEERNVTVTITTIQVAQAVIYDR